jgi:GPH family glycoside/pentoside/hexuronide:cation symporter
VTVPPGTVPEVTVPDRLPRRISLSYGVGSVGTGIYSTVPGLLLLFYLTDVLGVRAGIASVVLLVPKLWDAVLNPVVGTWSDRRGARRPFLLAGAIGLPVFFVLLFSVPRLSPGHAALYVAIVYTLAMTAFALFQVPYISMPAEMTSDYHERTRLMSIRMVLLTVGILVGGALAPSISGGKQGGRHGYAVMGLVVGALLAAALLTCWRGTSGVRSAAPASGAQVSIREQAALIRANPGFLALVSAYTLQAVSISGMLAGAPYVATYVLGDSGLAAVLFVFLVAPAALVMPIWRRLSLTRGKLPCYFAATLLFGVVGATLVFGRIEPRPLIYVQVALLGVGYAGMQLFPYAMLPDAVSADQDRAGEARAGVYTGVWQGVETIGYAVGPALYGFSLALTGFVSSSADVRVAQPSSAITGLIVGFSLLPAAFVLASLPVLRRYASVDAVLSAANREILV